VKCRVKVGRTQLQTRKRAVLNEQEDARQFRVMTLRKQALAVLVQADPEAKARLASDLTRTGSVGADEHLSEPTGLPGRPARPLLVPHTELKKRSITTAAGRAALFHAVAHIELNAIDLAADAVWRFSGMPEAFYREWSQVAREEAYHFTLLTSRLRELGFAYGDFPAHNALWQMAEKTKHDVLARMALVPRTLEARGLDASPPMREKLARVGDTKGVEILDIILRDEIGHVAVGNRWYAYLCAQRGLEPVETYTKLAAAYGAPRLRGPFNLEARRAAGFTDRELEDLAR
jgi:uncharacterized ferritin-like protein (DUF455 family)